MKADSGKNSAQPLLRPETVKRLQKLPPASREKVLGTASKVLARHLKTRSA